MVWRYQWQEQEGFTDEFERGSQDVQPARRGGPGDRPEPGCGPERPETLITAGAQWRNGDEPGKPLRSEASSEVQRLQRELRKVTMEHDILKMALGCFAKDPQCSTPAGCIGQRVLRVAGARCRHGSAQGANPGAGSLENVVLLGPSGVGKTHQALAWTMPGQTFLRLHRGFQNQRRRDWTLSFLSPVQFENGCLMG